MSHPTNDSFIDIMRDMQERGMKQLLEYSVLHLHEYSELKKQELKEQLNEAAK